MEFQNHKCSSKAHKDAEPSIYCQECNAYFCNKCVKIHSELVENHHTFLSDKDNNKLFTGFCKEKNHKNELYYFCKDHNTLCCGLCISKIKTRENGKHHDCNVCDINDIFDEKKKNLTNNIKNLENLSDILQSLLNELKKTIEEIDQNKVKIKEEIKKIFNKILNELKNREVQLLNEVDKIFEKKFNIENINNILKDKNNSEKIKKIIKKGKLQKKNGIKIKIKYF